MRQANHDTTLPLRDLGRLDYAGAFAVQQAAHAAVVAGESAGVLLLVEHDPVITVSRRPGATANVLASADQLGQWGIDVQPTNRGGDVTYHGPGQLVAYPILPLRRYRWSISDWMRQLETLVITVLDRFGIAARRVEGCTGVWVDVEANADPTCNTGAAKIAALGVRLSRGVTLHGLALNVTTNLQHFDAIVPCGLANRNVTSMAAQLGDAVPDMAAVKTTLAETLNTMLAERQAALATAPGAEP